MCVDYYCDSLFHNPVEFTVSSCIMRWNEWTHEHLEYRASLYRVKLRQSWVCEFQLTIFCELLLAIRISYRSLIRIIAAILEVSWDLFWGYNPLEKDPTLGEDYRKDDRMRYTVIDFQCLKISRDSEGHRDWCVAKVHGVAVYSDISRNSNDSNLFLNI